MSFEGSIYPSLSITKQTGILLSVACMDVGMYQSVYLRLSLCVKRRGEQQAVRSTESTVKELDEQVFDTEVELSRPCVGGVQMGRCELAPVDAHEQEAQNGGEIPKRKQN